MSNIIKGIVDEGENVAVLYIDGKPSTKYAKQHEADADVKRLRAKFPNKKIELKQEVRETEAIKGADGKRCWKGKRYAGTVNGKDKCIPVKESAYEKDLQDHEPRTVQGVYGMKSKPFSKKFKNQAHQDRFFDHPDREGNYEIQYVQRVDEASGTPGGIEMHRTPQMVDLAMQQNLYKKDLEAVKKAAGKKPSTPRNSIPMVHIGSSGYPVSVFQTWVEDKDMNAALKYAVNKFANKQSAEFKNELGSDSEFKSAVLNFFNVGAESIAAKAAAKPGWSGRIDSDYRTKELTSAGFDAIHRINQVLLTYMKKYNVDKTGRRVPPGFNYSLGESISMDENTYEIGQQLMDIAQEIKELADNAMRLVRGTPEEGRARSYWYPHIVMALGDDHGYMGKNMATMSQSAEALMNGEDEEYMDEARAPHPLLKAANKNLVDLASGEVRKREDAKKAAAKREREYQRQAARDAKPKKPTLDQIWQKIEHAISNYFPDGDPTDYLGPYMDRNNLTWDDITKACKRQGYKDLWDYWNTLAQDIENDAYGDWMATGGKNVRQRAPFMETPDTSGPVGTQPGGWRTTNESRSSILKGIGRAR